MFLILFYVQFVQIIKSNHHCLKIVCQVYWHNQMVMRFFLCAVRKCHISFDLRWMIAQWWDILCNEIDGDYSPYCDTFNWINVRTMWRQVGDMTMSHIWIMVKCKPSHSSEQRVICIHCFDPSLSCRWCRLMLLVFLLMLSSPKAT